MRKSYDGLGGVVRQGLGRDPLNGEVFIFLNRRLHNPVQTGGTLFVISDLAHAGPQREPPLLIRTCGATTPAPPSSPALCMETTTRTDGAKKLPCTDQRYQTLLQRPVPAYWPQSQGFI